MAESWELTGDYFETSSCDFLCPCILSNWTAQPTKGGCIVGSVFHIDDGVYGQTPLNGQTFAMLAVMPGPMSQPASWDVGLIVDTWANQPQIDAIKAIALGQAGGPMARLVPLFSRFLGIEVASIQYENNGLKRSVAIAGKLEASIVGVESVVRPGEPLLITNTVHPVSSTLALARGTSVNVNMFGLSWNDATGKNNGHFAPISWAG